MKIVILHSSGKEKGRERASDEIYDGLNGIVLNAMCTRQCHFRNMDRVCVCVRTFLLKGQFNIKSQQICVDARDNPTRHLANNDDDDVLKYAHRIA